MATESQSHARAVRVLQRQLVRRRLQWLGSRLRLELALLALLLGGFLFWQVRAPFDGLRRAHGPLAVVLVIAIAWLILAVLGASLTAARHVKSLRSGPAGPAWLALPLEPGVLARHLEWESRTHALVMVVPACAVLVAGFGLVPVYWLLLLAAGFAWLLVEAARLGCLVGLWVATRGLEPRPGLPTIHRVLARAAGIARARRLPAARWRRMRGWRALLDKDMHVTWRAARLRATALVPAFLGAVSLLVWVVPLGSGAGAPPPELRPVAAFFLAMGCAATLAEWLAELAGSDPFGALRPLPVGLGVVWWSRAAWAVAATVVLVVGHQLLAFGLAPGPRHLFLLWIGGATLAIAALGINYGVTLFPRADTAKRMLGLSLGLAVVASLMFPLAGWIVLLTAILHSSRRLSHWDRLEDV
jgi:hypothetical protein